MSVNVDFASLISQYGHNVLIRRRLDVISANGAGSLDSEKYASYLERHTAYRTMESPGMPGVHVKNEGIVSDLEVKFYFKPSAKPKTSDLIYEETPHERWEYERWRIERVVPFYIDNEVKYFVAHVKRLDPVS